MTVAVRVENVTNAPIYFNFCSSTLEREATPGRWESIGGVVCNALGADNPLDLMLMIPAGGVREMPLHMYSWGNVGIDLLASTYRLRLSIATTTDSPVARRWGYTFTSQSLPTNEFTLEH